MRRCPHTRSTSDKVLGTVTMAAADHVMRKDRDGKDVTVKVTKAKPSPH